MSKLEQDLKLLSMDLAKVLNIHGADSAFNMPDFVLANNITTYLLAISQGWVLVPPNPTKEMIEAMYIQLEVTTNGKVYGLTTAWREALKRVDLSAVECKLPSKETSNANYY